jgi:N,N'-diacetyllegionaminate synthase
MKLPEHSFIDSDRVLIIAEAGVNHDGDVRKACELCDAAKSAGADAVKFQTWLPGECTGRYATKVAYLQKGTSNEQSRFDVSSSLCLPYSAFKTVAAHCEDIGIDFLSTPDGVESLEFLVKELDVRMVKVSSTEVTNLGFIEAAAMCGRPVILSTGLSTLGEVERCVEILRRHAAGSFALLHCTSEYPAPDEELNIRAMVTMGEAFRVPVGYSDHSSGLEAALVATTLGARIIEKHLTLDRCLPGPDHAASLEPDEFAHLVRSVRRAEVMLGDGIKRPTIAESANVAGIRRGVVAARTLNRGEVITRDMLCAKRPFRGVNPEQADLFVGFELTRKLEADEPILWDDVR